MKSTVNLLCCCVAWSAVQILVPEVEANADAKRLYDDLLSGYNRLDSTCFIVWQSQGPIVSLSLVVQKCCIFKC